MTPPVGAGNWPYPRWIAHRGAGKLAPENTLAAFRLGAEHGYRMFECDVKLSADEIPFLLHDANLERTTTGSGVGGKLSWQELSQLDAGSWHSSAYVGEPIPSLSDVVGFCLAGGHALNVEIKPTPGTASRTGKVIATHLSRYWSAEAAPPLLTSFDISALEGAKSAQPQLPRGLLLHGISPAWLDTARNLGCVALIIEQGQWNENTVGVARQAGFRLLAYAVNSEPAAQRLLTLGLDGIITDRIDLFAP